MYHWIFLLILMLMLNVIIYGLVQREQFFDRTNVYSRCDEKLLNCIANLNNAHKKIIDMEKRYDITYL